MIGVVDLIHIVLQGIITFLIIDRITNIKQNIRVFTFKIVCLFFSVLIWHCMKDTSSLWYIIGIGLDILNFVLYTVLLKRHTIFKTVAVVIILKSMNVFLKIITDLMVSQNNLENSLYFMSEKIIASILIIIVIYAIIWIIVKEHERERRLLWEDNIRMAARLHRLKETLPLLNNVLETLRSNEKADEFRELLNEMQQLCKEQIIECENQNMQYKSFPSTNIQVLDEQIKLYGQEAARKGINFDFFVNTSMSKILKDQNISHLDFLRMIGDLMRNAFRAIEKCENKAGNILLIMGCVNEVTQVEIYDDGVLFPIKILNEFGKRGNTDGGTGHGLADLIDSLERYQASLEIIEYEGKAQFSKGISIRWDQQNDRYIDTFRGEQLSNVSILRLQNLELKTSQ